MTFDPLHKWLGIPASEQPPNHYRLLGIALFEDDPDVIDAAADKQLVFLHDMTNGAHGQAAEDLSNRVSAARLCLCSQAKKAAYDESLRSSQRAPVARPTPRSGSAPLPDVAPPPGSPSGSGTTVKTPNQGRDAQQSGWLLRHADGVEHGPFPFSGLRDAAQRGHIATTTQVRHSLVTSNQWVQALSLPQIADACPQPSPVSPQSPVANPQPRPAPTAAARRAPMAVKTRRKPKSADRSPVATIIASVIPGVLLIAIAAVVYRNPRMRTALAGLLSPAEPAPPEVVPEVRIQPRPRSSPRAPSRPYRRPASPDANAGTDGTAEREEPVDRMPLEPIPLDRSFGFPVDDATDQPDAPRHRLRLDLSSSRWSDPLGEADENATYFVEGVENAPVTVELDPPSGELSFDRVTTLRFEDFQGFGLELRLTRIGGAPTVSVAGRFVVNEKTPFRWTTFKKQHSAIVDDFNKTGNLLRSLTAEQTQLNLFLKSRTAKTLEIVNKAQDRLNVVRSQLPVTQRAFVAAEQRWKVAMPLMQKVTKLHEEGELVIRAEPSNEASSPPTDMDRSEQNDS